MSDNTASGLMIELVISAVLVAIPLWRIAKMLADIRDRLK